MTTPHIHAELIKVWADGANIQCWSTNNNKWADVPMPVWSRLAKYRVKPVPSMVYLCFVKVSGHSDWVVGGNDKTLAAAESRKQSLEKIYGEVALKQVIIEE